MSQPAEKALSRDVPFGYVWCSLMAESFCLAISGKCLGLALAGILAMTVGWQFVGWIILPQANGDPELQAAATFHSVISAWPGGTKQVALPELFATKFLPTEESSFVPIDPVRGVPYRLVEPFRRVFSTGRSWPSLAYYVLGGFVSLAIWALIGGAITRVAVVQYGLGQSVALQEAIRFAIRRWVAFFSAPALSLVGIAMIAFPFISLGWVMRLDVGFLFAGVIWAGVLLAGLLMTVLILGLTFGWPLMWGTISTENSDAFDAISRSYAYTFQRPLHYLFYAVMASMLGICGWLLAWWFAESVVSLSFWAVSLGCGNERIEELRLMVDGVNSTAETTSIVWMGAMSTRITVGLVRATASAFSFSYFWCVAGALYLLLRRHTDQTQLNEVVCEEHEDSEFGPHNMVSSSPVEFRASNVDSVSKTNSDEATIEEP